MSIDVLQKVFCIWDASWLGMTTVLLLTAQICIVVISARLVNTFHLVHPHAFCIGRLEVSSKMTTTLAISFCLLYLLGEDIRA